MLQIIYEWLLQQLSGSKWFWKALTLVLLPIVGASAPKNWTARDDFVASLGTGNTSLDFSSGTIVTVVTGVAAGSEVPSVRWATVGTLSADTRIRFARYDGTNYAPYGNEVYIRANTPATPGSGTLSGVWYPPDGPVWLGGTSDTIVATVHTSVTIKLSGKRIDY